MHPHVAFHRWAAVPLLLLMLAATVSGQQTYVSRFDFFGGYTYLDSPKVGLSEHGFHTQFGVRPWTWLSLGFDYSVAKGDLSITPNLLLDSLQQSLGAQLGALIKAGVLPANYSLVVPASSTTQTFAAGPQVAFRHWKPVTLFLRPSCGIIAETATPHPGDPVSTGIVKQLSPTGSKHDNTIFYGFGGGIDFNVSKHVAIRMQTDLVRDHLFDDLLKDSRGTVRVSIGPAFNFGKNIAEK